jgi:flagellar P-ring protein precursor FlgI
MKQIIKGKENSKRCLLLLVGIAVVLMTATVFEPAQAARIKDLTSIKGVRTNQLTGYGLVVGLDGTGDKSGTEFTIQSLVNMLERMGINVDKKDVSVKNVAAVVVTAKLPPFARIGSKMDVVVSSIGDAKSLVGGTLLFTPLRGADGNVYALAQGPISVGGVGASGASGSSVTKNHLLAARIAGGATIEREVAFSLNGKKDLTLTLLNPDFTTALRMSETINAAMGEEVAKALDSGALELNIPEAYREDISRFLANVETLEVDPDTVARIVVNEKTGTVVIGQNVRISTVAVSHGNLSITIDETQIVSQPRPFTEIGQTVVTPESDIEIRESDNQLMVVDGGATIGELVRALNAIGVTPRDLISIFQSIKAAGALQAELKII